MLFSNKTKKFYKEEKEMNEAEKLYETVLTEKKEAKDLINEKIKELNDCYKKADDLKNEIVEMLNAYIDTYVDYSNEWDRFFNTETMTIESDDEYVFKCIDKIIDSLFE